MICVLKREKADSLILRAYTFIMKRNNSKKKVTLFMNDDKTSWAYHTTSMHISVNYIDFARGLHPTTERYGVKPTKKNENLQWFR